MKSLKIYLMALMAAALLTLPACSDSKSYAELLKEETEYVNEFLADQRVVGHVPADSVFEVGPTAPYYMIEPEGNVYMQVLDAGDLNVKPEYDDRVYFRFTRYSLALYEDGVLSGGGGNADDVAGGNGLGSTYFLFDNLQASSSSMYGNAIQLPMHFLGNNAKVNLVVKSQFGWSNETANVTPFLYNIRYYSSPLSPWENALPEE